MNGNNPYISVESLTIVPKASAASIFFNCLPLSLKNGLIAPGAYLNVAPKPINCSNAAKGANPSNPDNKFAPATPVNPSNPNADAPNIFFFIERLSSFNFFSICEGSLLTVLLLLFADADADDADLLNEERFPLLLIICCFC